MSVDGPPVMRCLFAHTLTGVLPASPARRPSKWAGWHLDVVGTERHVSQVGVVGLPLSVGHGEEVGYLVSTSSGHMVWVGLRGQLRTPCPEWPALPPTHHALAA